MKKTTLASLATALVTLPLLAQANVTLYGVVDMGLNHVSNHNGHSANELRSGNSLTSRLGLRGTQDLGGGTRVAFDLQSGINADAGTSSSTTFWNRQSWLGISRQGVGELRAGLQLSVLNDVFTSASNSTYLGTQTAAVDGSAAPGAAAARFNNMIGGTRVANSLKFTSQETGGFQFKMMLALGEKEDSSRSGRLESAGLTYRKNQWQTGLVYQLQRCVTATACSNDQILGLGATYHFARKAQLSAYVTQQKNARNIAGNDANVVSLLAIYPIERWTLLAGYQQLNDQTALDQNVAQYNLGLKYALSKRTDVYTLFSAQKVDNQGQAGMFSKTSSDGRQNQWNVGLRHSF